MSKKDKQQAEAAENAAETAEATKHINITDDGSKVEENDLDRRITELTEENDRLRDQMLRARAEFENFRRRKNREFEEFSALANESLIEDLLPVLDDLALLINNAEDKQDVAGLLEGAKLIQQKFSDTLRKRGLEEVKAEGEPFDPDLHEALLETPSPDAEPGTILNVHQTGYKLGNKLIRPSRVIIAAASDQEG
ncbi:nucleotide exchange factor GrpE [bacterium]|nr:nucleotide exchange factor GrpE [bacterium]